MINIEIWASGKGSNARNIVEYFSTSNEIRISTLASNRQSSGVFQLAEDHGIASIHFSNSYYNSPALVEDLKKRNPDFIVLAGFLKLVPQPVISAFAGRIINVHPSLLPKFGGKGMYGDYVHEAVIASNERQSGITIHEVNEEFDKGKLVAQYTVNIAPNENVESLKLKIAELEKNHFPTTICHWALTNLQS